MPTSDDAASRGEASRKSAGAFRTISEVATELDLPQHVLRFWETKFQQIKPLKRGGGRRYYRPEDIQLLRRIRDLLYIDGYTIKGVQKLMRQSGGMRQFAAETAASSDDDRDMTPAVTPPGTKLTSVSGQSELAAVLEDLRRLRDDLSSASR